MLFWHAETKKRPETIGLRALDTRMPRRRSGASTFFHPDCTVGFGVSPNRPCGSRAVTAGGESHPALKMYSITVASIAQAHDARKNRLANDSALAHGVRCAIACRAFGAHRIITHHTAAKFYVTTR